MGGDEIEPIQQWRAELGEELWSLIVGLHGGLAEVTLLSSRSAVGYAGACWRLRFQDGTLARGRRVTSARKAARYQRLSQFLPRPPFPRIWGREGSSLLLEWIPGSVLSGASRDWMRVAGEIQGAVHASVVPGELVVAAEIEEKKGLERLERRLEVLVQRGLLSPAEMRLAQSRAESGRPHIAECGLMHGDFCGENFIVDPGGQFWVIDNETLKVDCLDYDLAKTLYRWPMGPDLWQAYLSGYRKHRSSGSFEKHSGHYVIRATASSAYHRAVRGSGDVEIPLAALRRHLFFRPPASGESGVEPRGRCNQ